MIPRTRTVVVSLLVLVVVAFGVRAMLKPKAPTPPPVVAAAPSVLEFLPTEIITAEPVELRQTLLLSGSLRAVDLATVKAKVAGDVREVMVREGEPVKAGQIVAKIDATEFEARVAQARGNLNNAKAQLEIAGKSRDNNLALMEKGFISKNAFDNSASQFSGARASVDAAQGALDIVQKSLNDTLVRAPISGLVSARHAQPGEKVAVDGKLLEIVNLHQLELEAAIPASEIAQVAVGQKVELRVEGLTSRFDGRVARINPATQAGSRSVSVYIQLANPQNQLRAGMFAEGQLILGSKRGVLALPQSAVRKRSGESFVFAIVNGKIERKPVTVGSSGVAGDEYQTEITSGLDFGTQVIRADMGNLAPGTPVRIAQPAASK